MSQSKKPVLGIFLGEAAGIGPELVAKVVADGSVYEYCRPLLLGDKRVLDLGMKIAGVSFPYTVVENAKDAKWGEGLPIPILDMKNFDPKDLKVGTIDLKSGYATGEGLVLGMDLLKAGLIDGYVFAPLNKEAFKKGGWHVEDEHYLFARELNWLDKPRGLLNVLDDLWVFRLSGHIPFKDIPKYVTKDNLRRSIQLCYDTLRQAGIEKPVIGVAALNPHAGDGGTCGMEEIEVITPVINEFKERGINVVGPVSADTIFIHAFNKEYNGVVTLYHDQGQIATKIKAFDIGVTAGGGLPFGITTPEHGTAFDIAGKGIAKTQAMKNAIRTCAQMAMTTMKKREAAQCSEGCCCRK